ncbi:hypothetical protein DDE82_008182 [Stemphylium lycopersici]|nr:hypothetical protein DDE82_008182 [Stemphylium lycopersici]
MELWSERRADSKLVVDEIPSPTSSDACDSAFDAEAANQQLLSESRSPVAKPPPPPAAVLGASLLNAARVRNSSQAGGTVRKNGAGKLKRVSIVTRGPKQDLARRGDLYDIELSPEKGAYALPQKVNQKPLKIVKKMAKAKKKGGVSAQRSDALDISSDAPVHRAVEAPSEQDHLVGGLASTDLAIRSSPPEVALAGSDTIVVDGAAEDAPSKEVELRTVLPGGVRIEKRLANGKPRCTAVSYKYDKKLGSRYQQCLGLSIRRNDVGARCAVHMNKAPAVQCGEEMLSEKGTSQCHRTATTDTVNGARCSKHAENQHPEPNHKRQSGSNHGGDRHSKLQRTKKRHPSRPASPGKTKTQARNMPEASDGRISDSEDEGSDFISAHKPTEVQKNPRDNLAVAIQQLPTRTRRSIPQPESSEASLLAPELAPADREYESESEPDVEKVHDTRQDGRTAHAEPGNIDNVFKFLDLEEHSGKCQIKFATTIGRKCDRSCTHLHEESVSMNTVIEDATDIQETLKHTDSEIRDKHRSAFKGDAYGHVFRSLTLYLEALYSWLQQTHRAVTESLEAMRVITPLTHAILAFKDTIASWDVSVPPSHKGGRVFKDVDIRLIAPLRQVHKTFNARLRELEDTEQRRVQYAETKRKMQEQRDAEHARIETIETKNKRKKRWQDLHIVRMQCEPNNYRRHKLYTTRIEDLEERDANGVVFERLPIFKPRSTQPQSQVAEPTDVLEWTDEEEIALLGGLEQFTVSTSRSWAPMVSLWNPLPTIGRPNESQTRPSRAIPRVFQFTVFHSMGNVARPTPSFTQPRFNRRPFAFTPDERSSFRRTLFPLQARSTKDSYPPHFEPRLTKSTREKGLNATGTLSCLPKYRGRYTSVPTSNPHPRNYCNDSTMAPYDPAAHRRHYENTTHTSLQALAKLRSQNPDGSKEEIVARLMAQDANTGTWHGMYYQSATEVNEEPGSAPDGDEGWEVVCSRKHTKAARAEKVEAIPEDIGEEQVTIEEKASVSETGSCIVIEEADEEDIIYPIHEIVHDESVLEKDEAIPMAQLADEWDAYLTTPTTTFISKTTVARFQDTSGSSSTSASTGATTPVDLDRHEPRSWADEASEAASEEKNEELPVGELKDALAPEEERVGEASALEETAVDDASVLEDGQVQVEELTKRKRKREKKGSKKVNKSKAAQPAVGSLEDTAVIDTVSAQSSENLPAASSSVEVAPVEVFSDTTGSDDAAEESLFAPSADDNDVSGQVQVTGDSGDGIDQDLPFVDAQAEIKEPAPAVVVQQHAEQKEEAPEPEMTPTFPAPSVSEEAPEPANEIVELKKGPDAFSLPASPAPTSASLPAFISASSTHGKADTKASKTKGPQQAKPPNLLNTNVPGHDILVLEATVPGDEASSIDAAEPKQKDKQTATLIKKQRKRGKKGGKKAKKSKKAEAVDAPLTRMGAIQAGISAVGLTLVVVVLGVWMKR